MKVIVSRKVTVQVNDNEFETYNDSTVFDESASISDIRKWSERNLFAYYKSPVIQLMALFEQDKGGEE